MYIYGLTDPKTQELRYIGFTSKSVQHRLRFHVVPSELNRKNHKAHWIKSLINCGLKPEIFIIQETDADHWQFDEQWNIEYFRAIGCRLTNICKGGKITANWAGRKHSPETIEKMRQANLGNKNPNFGRKDTEDQIEVKRLRKLGTHLTQEVRDKISRSHMGVGVGRKPTNEIREKMSITHKKLGVCPEILKKSIEATSIKIPVDVMLQIKQELKQGVAQQKIAKKYSISQTTVWRIKAGIKT